MNWFRLVQNRRRKAFRRTDRGVVGFESLESREMLAAVIPMINLNNQAPIILPAVNSKQLLAVGTGVETQLFTTDGTQAGTVLFSTITGTLAENSREFTDYAILGSDLYFATASSGGHAIWKTDGTTVGTINVLQEPSSNHIPPSNLYAFSGAV